MTDTGHFTVHHSPGRLRVYTTRWRGTGAARHLASVLPFLRAQPGVVSAEARRWTGSVIVTFDPNVTDGRGLLVQLLQAGYLPPGPSPTRFARPRLRLVYGIPK